MSCVRQMVCRCLTQLTVVAQEVALLNHAVLIYLSTTTAGLNSGDGRPVLVTGAQRSAIGTAKYISAAPSMQDAVDLVHAYGEQAAGVAKDYRMVAEREKAKMPLITEDEVSKMTSMVLDQQEYSTAEAVELLKQHSQMLYSESSLEVELI